MTKGKMILLTLISGILLPLAVPNELTPLGNPLIVLFCLVPFFYALHHAPTYRFASCLGAIFGAINTYLTYYWLMFFGDFSIWTINGVALACALFGAILGTFLCAFMKKFPNQRVLMLAGVWTAYELLKSTGFLAFPWGLLAHPLHSIAPLVQIADITGVWGVSFLAAFCNALTAEAFICRGVINLKQLKSPNNEKLFPNPHWNRNAVTFFLLLGIYLTYGIIRLNTPIPSDKEVTVLLIQQNRDPWATGNKDTSIFEGMELTRKGMKTASEVPDIIAWSETNFQLDLITQNNRFERYPAKDPLLPFIREQNTYFFAGCPYIANREPLEVYNSAALLDPQGYPVNQYGKIQLVPVAEGNPLWGLPIITDFLKNVVGLYGVWTPGDEYTVFTIPVKDGHKFKFSAPICFEDAFPDLCRQFILNGAEGWINLTNVSWSQTKSAEYQMFIAAKFRSIENRRVLIRSTNSGVTSVVDAYGNTLASLPLFQKDLLFMDVPVQKDKYFSIYTLWGDWFPLIIIFTFLTALFIREIKKKRGPVLLNDLELNIALINRTVLEKLTII